jgi:epoxyqueuosine reductase
VPGESYQDLVVWRSKARELAGECYRITKTFPREEMFGMTSQIRRSSTSIAANIAEGWGRGLPDPNLSTNIKLHAHSLGFDLVGITSAEPSAFAEEYRDWIARGYAGEMGYLAHNMERRLDPRELLPDARSIIVVGMNYYTRSEERGTRNEGGHSGEGGRKRGSEGTSSSWGDGHGALPVADDPQLPTPHSLLPHREAVFARYARGDDYHNVMTPRLKQLLAYIKELAGPETEGRVYVDTGPILEREVARRAGLGWFGKNTMLINTRRGSYFFLGEIVTNLALTADSPAVGGCGTCTRCLDACPTNAFTAPFVLDSRRCISYLTIELKGQIPQEYVPAIAETGRIYGCDICQEVCPFNTDREEGTGNREQTMPGRAGAPSPADPAQDKLTSTTSALTPNTKGQTPIHGPTPTPEPAFQPRPFVTDIKDVKDLLYLTREEFSAAFKGSAVKRAKRRGLLRNAIAALNGCEDLEAVAALEHAQNDTDPVVRGSAKAALECGKSSEAS